MFKQLSALIRGHSVEAAEAVADRHATTILRQQIRDCAAGLEAARKATALAIAQERMETGQQTQLNGRIAELEERTIAALNKGEDALAREAADVIARLEGELDASRAAQKAAAPQIARLKKAVQDGEARLRQLQRGQRTLRATELAQRLAGTAPQHSLASLDDAERTLARLQHRQHELEATAIAMSELTSCDDPAAMNRKLAEAGCGPATGPTADSVLARLAARRAQTA